MSRYGTSPIRCNSMNVQSITRKKYIKGSGLLPALWFRAIRFKPSKLDVICRFYRLVKCQNLQIDNGWYRIFIWEIYTSTLGTLCIYSWMCSLILKLSSHLHLMFSQSYICWFSLWSSDNKSPQYSGIILNILDCLSNVVVCMISICL